nr:SMR family transporter [Selenomonas ruminantium]
MLKASCGVTKLMPSVAFIVGMGTCFYIFSKSLMLLPLGIAYAIWAGWNGLDGIGCCSNLA